MHAYFLSGTLHLKFVYQEGEEEKSHRWVAERFHDVAQVAVELNVDAVCEVVLLEAELGRDAYEEAGE